MAKKCRLDPFGTAQSKHHSYKCN